MNEVRHLWFSEVLVPRWAKIEQTADEFVGKFRTIVSRTGENRTGSIELNFAVSFPGVDVMITIVYDFRKFSAKKLAFFSKTNVMVKIEQNIAVV
jgi:hypothetical protein